MIYFINPNPRPSEWQGALGIEDAGWACRHLVISPAGYLLYVPLDRNTLLGKMMRSVDGIIGDGYEFNEIGLNLEVVNVLLWSECPGVEWIV